MTDVQIELLKHFVSLCQTDPDILHQPQMAFYRQYLESLGATIPPPKSSKKQSNSDPNQPQAEEASENTTKSQHFEEPEEEIPPPDLDETGVIPPEEDQPLPMGDDQKQVTDEDLEKANENRDLANAAFAEGDFETSLQHYTKAIEANPDSAILFAKRANVLLKMNKPLSAIRDCDRAIYINPDSAQGYKFRGRANRLMGKWLEAHQDLAMACKLDYDDTANEWLKEVEPNAKKLHDYKRAKERQAEEKELRERRARVERAREANKRAAEASNQGFDDEEGGGGFGMGGFTELFKELADDPELLQMLKQDPTLITKLTEIMQNPANMMKHIGDPAVQKLISKLGSRFGATGPPPFGTSDEKPPTSSGSAQHNAEANEPTYTKKAPEPDLD